MDVHKPKAPHGVREFIAEIAVIVLGVLIALGAEQLVQMIEWRHKVHAAEEAMAAELRDDNGPQAYARMAISECLKQRLDEIRGAVESGADRATVVRLARAYQLPFWTWDSLGLQAATASNAFTRMSAERGQTWSLAYAVVPALDRANEREFRDLAELHAIRGSGGALTADEQAQILRAVELLRQDAQQIFIAANAFLPKVYEAGVRFVKSRTDRMLTNMRRLGFDTCMITPPPPPDIDPEDH